MRPNTRGCRVFTEDSGPPCRSKRLDPTKGGYQIDAGLAPLPTDDTGDDWTLTKFTITQRAR